jgi:hypothetical protein
MVAGSLGNDRICERRQTGGKEGHGEILPEGQGALAEEMVAPWRSALQKIGVKVTVDVYTGSLSRVVENYRREDQISLIIRAENDLPIMRFLHRPSAFFGLFKKASLRPVLSLRSDH